jgi:hypothetical protein
LCPTRPIKRPPQAICGARLAFVVHGAR